MSNSDRSWVITKHSSTGHCRATSNQIGRLTINACGWVILDTQVNVLIDAKPKVACVTEVASEQLVLLYLQAALLQTWHVLL